MPVAKFGEEIKFGGGGIFKKLKSQGDKIHFRLLDAPYYDGKHYFKDSSDKWEAMPCVRINEGNTCEYCNTYFQMIENAKSLKTEAEQKQAKKDADAYRADVTFYYPVINRELEEFNIFKTKISIRNKLEIEGKAGIPLLERDFIVTRTEEPGQNYYSLTRLDSADTKPLTTKERTIIEEYKTMDLEGIVYGTQEEDSAVTETAKNVEDTIIKTESKKEEYVDPEDIPF